MSQSPRHDDPHNPAGTIIRAFFRNQEQWLIRLATAQTEPTLPHPRIRHDDTVTTVRTGTSCVMTLSADDPGDTPDLPAVERSWDWLRRHNEGNLLVWALNDRPAMNLALLARGFDDSFRPTWMSRELSDALPEASARGVEIRVGTAHDIDELRQTTAIPYLIPDQLISTKRLALDEPRAVWWLIARDRAGVVGQAIVNMTGEMAGLFNVAVHPRARRRGIGRALTTAAMELARDLGAPSMGLNATGDGFALYEALGFRHLGDGMTWFLPARRSHNVPSPELIEAAEALGRGDIDALERMDLPRRLANADLPMQFAARFGQVDVARWLLERGADPDVLALWDLGLREEAVAAMGIPRTLNRPSGPLRGTPLHQAVERNDTELAELLIAAGADLDARDVQHRATPLEWAEYLDRAEIASMIRAASRR